MQVNNDILVSTHVSIPISRESLEMWEADDCGFTNYVINRVLSELQESHEKEIKRIENETINGVEDENSSTWKTVGIIRLRP